MTVPGHRWVERFLLPGFAFKAVVIGGGYATGRELAEFFLPSGPRGGLLAMGLATAVWSVVCIATFLFATKFRTNDYHSFFHELLGPFSPVFDIAYAAFIVLVLAVFGAAAGAIASATFGLPALVGTLGLVTAIAAFAAFGNDAVESLFKWITLLLYGTYALFAVLALSSFGDRIAVGLANDAPAVGWVAGGLNYAGYNVVGAVIVLPVLRHLTRPRDAVVAGLLAGPLAMLPALLFFICMLGHYPEIGAQPLPSDYLLERLDLPAFRYLFQAMILAALLESGTGAVHAVNERVAAALPSGTPLPRPARLSIAGAILVGSVFLADRFGLVALIANGYRALAYVFLAVFVAPLLTRGMWRVLRAKPAAGTPW